ARAWAAFPRTRREIRFSPATSVTEYIMVISQAPTYEATLPEAMVDTINFGSPIGMARMARVIIAVPPEPPIPTMPPRCGRDLTKHSKASAMAATASPRSRQKTALAPWGWCAAISAADVRIRVDDGGRRLEVEGGVLVEISTRWTRTPAASSRSQ